ncbi:MAG TPA: hypothetical protein VEL51_07845 [Vicinamibacterales bacterium]|nr:hypothetical protein [Vicinamibacterales bacterium]
MRIFARAGVLAALLPLLAGRAVCAQEKVTLRSDVLLYGDNTEFRNPFREGETIFGAAARVFVDFELNPRATISLGAFGNQRFGSEKAFEQARPVIAMTVKGKRSTFVFGTLPAKEVGHGLLPPLQRETLAFERPYEAGLQWDFRGAAVTHSIWLEWQQLNTPAHRERFDGGLNARVIARRGFSLPVQVHVVHEGGQLFASGPVDDSAAAAVGMAYGAPLRKTRMSLEAFGLVSKSVADRQQPALDRNGRAFFARIAAERGGWRAHALAWRGKDFIKDEGDANYLSIRRDGSFYRGTRDYAEAGLARRFTVAPGAVIEVSGRLHRTERYYEYSYRVLSVASLKWKLR